MRHLAEQKKRFGRTHARTDTFFFTLSKNKATLQVAITIGFRVDLDVVW